MDHLISKFRQKKLNELARKIIRDNQYVSLATTDSGGKPWISPVVYAYDNSWNLYFVSMPQSKHCQNIAKNKNAACAIFDSRQTWGSGIGLQIEAGVEQLTFKDTFRAGKSYITRQYPFGNPDHKMVMNFVQKYLAEKKLYKFYKVTPGAVWINNPYSETDSRVKVDLKG